MLARRVVLQGIGGAALVAGAGLGSACAQRGDSLLTAVDTHPEGYPTVEAVRFMGRLLAERSGGRLAIEHYPGGVLGQEKDSLEITIFGGIDLNRVNLAPLNSIVPETVVPALPFLFSSTEHMRNAMDGAPGRRILDALKPHGLIGLCYYDSGGRSFYTTKRAIERPEDLRGLKIRVQTSDLFVEMVRALGGSPTPMDFGEVYQGLLQGTVDGAENNWPSYESTRHFEAAKYYSETRHVLSPEVLTMSLRSWNKLSPEDQYLIRSCAEESVPHMRRLWDARVEQSRAAVLAGGVIHNEPDPRPFQELVKPVWERFLTTASMRNIVAEIAAMDPAA
ncbi:TRAP transporter substrate-binding protein [Altererythrobacter lutimaris]|uniref:TRAP transporter substrate-binding protein n=1 Tax=Altererythrobacter lutimaris TaxID=2743979 RepID=A0A850HBR1_9SPHN|nr:TRAP transporter substrate-binding protein [Altererythrobacter lutimaris]NVE94356.1 TRAP transporter substrate-binding protein [Altererythrobacter lutimaris]